jgi:hypothetical protein
MVSNFEEMFNCAVEGMKLVEERDWDLPWPQTNHEVDPYAPLNLRIYEITQFALPEFSHLKEEYERSLKEEESRKEIVKLFKKKKAQIKKLFKLCFVQKENSCRKLYNACVRSLVTFISLLGFANFSDVRLKLGILLSTLCFNYHLFELSF